MRQYKSYPAYKDSGVEWLGKVPEHWKVSRLASIFDERRTKVSDKDYSALSVTKQGVVPQLESVAKTDDSDNRRLVCKGDIAINSRSDRKGSSGLVDRDGSVSLIITVLKPRNSLLGGYAHHLIRSEAFQEEFYRVGNGLVADLWTTSYSSMREIKLPLPPLDEQEMISTRLDRETARIDALITKKTRFIELLREKRQALITHAVTKGLDSKVKMKDSGVEWLGEVPEHWGVRKLMYCTSFQGGYAFPSEMFCHEGIPVVRMMNLNRGRLNFDDVLCVPPSTVRKEFSLNFGDLLFGMSGSVGETGSLGNFAVVEERDLPAVLNQRVGRFRPYPGILSINYLCSVVQSSGFTEQVIYSVTGAAQANISPSQILSIVLAVPSFEEQAEISAWLSGRISKLENLIIKAESSIELLKERRRALVTAAVTGQMDLRGCI